MGRLAVWCLLAVFALLSSPVVADTTDINVVLYKDPNCFERADEMILLSEGCYANRFANLTKGFSLKIVVYGKNPLIDLTEYVSDCWPTYQFSPKRTLEGGKCQVFVGGFYAVLGLRFRSQTCEGLGCSPLSTAMQRFYSEEGCTGVAMKTVYYPLQGECMRYSNGTQEFTLSTDGKTITEVDYPGNDKCNAKDVNSTNTYTMEDGTCYSLYSKTAPMSFLWQVELGKNYAAITSRARPSAGAARGALLLVALWAAGAAALSPPRRVAVGASSA